MQPARPLYFPIKPEPFKMQPGLFRFGTDFGNGDDDRRFFPRDETAPRYLAEKARVLSVHPERSGSDVQGPADERALSAALRWLDETRSREGQAPPSGLTLAQLCLALCEDVAVLARSPAGAERVLYVHACFPGGWRPAQVLGQSFAQIHARIPAFDAVRRATPGLVDAMLTRGPYVRFVWTISADDELDHHPEQGRRQAWSSQTARGFLRVERQITVPLATEQASVFLIRTYLYGFDELARRERSLLKRALEQMPTEIAHYKRLENALPRALELLTDAGLK